MTNTNIDILGLSQGTPQGSDVYPSVDTLDPTQSAGGTTKKYSYADSVTYFLKAIGVNTRQACLASTVVNLSANYNNGILGVNATLTDNLGTFLPFTADGQVGVVGQRYLVSNQTIAFQNGIYTLTTNGNGTNLPWVLTRATDYNHVSNMPSGVATLIETGTVNANLNAQITYTGTLVVGTTNLVISTFAIPSLIAPLNPTLGGSGFVNPTMHCILIGEGSNPFNCIPLADGEMLLGVTGGDPVATIPLDGNFIAWTVGIGTLQANILGAITPVFGGSGLSNPTAHGILVSKGAAAYNPIVLGNQQILVGETSADPLPFNIVAGANILINFSSNNLIISSFYPPGFVNNFDLTWISSSQITIGAGDCASVSVNFNINYSGSPITLDITTSGAGGLDTGTVATSTWYGVHVIVDSTNVNPTSGVYSLNGGIGSSPAVMPAGYDQSRFLGWIRTDGSSNIYQFTQVMSNNNRRYEWKLSVPTVNVLSAGNSTTQATVDCSSFASPTAVLLEIHYAYTANTAGNAFTLFTTGTSASSVSQSNPVGGGIFMADQVQISCNSAQKIDYSVQESGDSLYLGVSAYIENI